MAFRRMGVCGTLAITNAALIAIMAGLMAQTTGEQSRQQLEQEIGRSLSEAAYQMADKLDTDMWSRTNRIGVLSKIDALRNWSVAQNVVAELKARDHSLAWVGVTDKDGKVVAASDGVLLGADASSRSVYREGVPVPGKKASNLDVIAGRPIAAVNEFIVISGRTVRVGCSIGVATWPVHGTTLHDVLEHADQALYAAKRARKNRAVDYGNIQERVADADVVSHA